MAIGWLSYLRLLPHPSACVRRVLVAKNQSGLPLSGQGVFQGEKEDDDIIILRDKIGMTGPLLPQC